MNDERSGIGLKRIVFGPEPDLKVGQRTIPVENLDQDGKGKTGKMDNFDRFVPPTPYRSENKKEDPEKMEKDDNVSKDSKQHFAIPADPEMFEGS